jgi:hypothetical protein
LVQDRISQICLRDREESYFKGNIFKGSSSNNQVRLLGTHDLSVPDDTERDGCVRCTGEGFGGKVDVNGIRGVDSAQSVSRGDVGGVKMAPGNVGVEPSAGDTPWHASYPGVTYQRSYQTATPRHGSCPGNVPVYLKKKSVCDVYRAFSEPNKVS